MGKASIKKCLSMGLAFGLVGFVSQSFAAPQMENISRGLAVGALQTGVMVSWRLLGTDDPKTTFTLYKNGTKLADIGASDPTTYVDASGSTSDVYTLIDGSGNESKTSIVFENAYKDNYGVASYTTVQLDRPAGVTTPDDYTCSYYPNDMSVGDLDGDGEYELIVKWDPDNSKDNSNTGYTGNVYIDAYKIDGTKLWRIDLGINIRAGAHYTQFMVWDLDGDGKAEVAMKTSDGTVDGVGTVIGDATADYRSTSGTIMSGNEYLTVFNGSTGAAITTVDYWPLRSVQASTSSGWGDGYGNRENRMLAAIAYLDGVHPSLIMCRGYYTYSYVAAYRFDGTNLVSQWQYSSPYEEGLYGEGNHNLSIADLDGDGYDEIVYGSAVLNHDGTLRYRTGLGHGDALHVGDFNPDLEGLEIWDVHEESGATYTAEMRDGSGNFLLTFDNPGQDNGRGLAADIDSTYRGYEVWSTGVEGVYNAITGTSISSTKPSTNFRVYFTGDLYDELMDGTSDDKGSASGTGGKLEKWNGNGVNRLLNLYGINSSTTINSTKSNPCLIADIFGDYREEIIMRQTGEDAIINIISTGFTTPHRVYALMHDLQYRESIAWQNVAYNQPPHLSYYLPDRADENLVQPSITLVASTDQSSTPSSIEFASIIEAAIPDDASTGYTETDHAGYLGESGYWNFANEINSYASYELTSTTATTTTLAVVYANGGTADRMMTVLVNGVSYSISFPATGWDTWDTSLVTIEVPEGDFTITFESATSDGGPNICVFAFDVATITAKNSNDETSEEVEDLDEEITGIYTTAGRISSSYNIQTGVLRSNKSGLAKVAVYDLRGQKVATYSKYVNAGYNQLAIDKNRLSKGIYMVKISVDSKSIGSFKTQVK